jgi:glycosyltransferase involved in cell wall biosynthesis
VKSRARVAIVTTYYRPVLGGAESAAERVATFLQRRGHEVTVFTKLTPAALGTDETLAGIRVRRLPPVGPRTPGGKWRFAPSVFRALRQARQQVDVVCCVDYRAIGLAALAARAFTHTPVLFYAQTDGVLSGSALRRLGSLLYRRTDALACISRAIEREALTAGLARERVHYVPNPVDTERFSPATPEERRRLRARLRVGEEDVLAVFVGRLSREKGAVELATAWATVEPKAMVAFIGPPMTGHDWDVSGNVARIARESRITPSFRLVGGVPPDEVASWLKAADFAVQPSHFEAMGLAAAEAMAAGLPVIVTDTSGYRDFVVDGENGLIVPPKDIRALGDAVTRLVQDSALRARLASRARETGAQFDETKVLGRLAEILDRLTP